MKKLVNKKASFDYFLDDCLEVGIVLTSIEVKSIIKGSVNLKQSYVKIIDNGKSLELFLLNCNITPPTNQPNIDMFTRVSVDPIRPKKLLASKKQIKKFFKIISEKTKTLIIKDMYISGSGKIKCTLCVGTGKKLYDKRQSLKEKDLKRRTKDEY